MTQDSAAEYKEPEKDLTRQEAEAERDVLPQWANVTMASLWVILFGGRWLLVPFIQMAGLLAPEQLAVWDDGMGQKLYLILLAITLVVLGLRFARRAQEPRSVSGPDCAARQRGTNP